MPFKNRIDQLNYHRQWRINNKEKLKQYRLNYSKLHGIEKKDYDHQYYLAHRHVRIAQANKWQKNHPKQRREICKKYLFRHPEVYASIDKRYKQKNRQKIRCRDKTRYNFPLGENCCKCGTTDNLQRHHPDYSRPDYFLTVCQPCHTKITLSDFKAQPKKQEQDQIVEV